MSAIRTELLSKRYGPKAAVDGLSIDVREGEIFGFLGPNGAGKTTTIAMLLGLVRPSSGRAWLLGHDVANPRALPLALAQVGAMIEAPAFYPYLSGRDNLRVLARVTGSDERRCEAVLAQVDLLTDAKKRVGAYSQGMKQRLAIAAALLHEPGLVILDEPTNGLDPMGTVEVRELIRGLAGGGRTVFLCSHVLHEVEQLCRRVAIMKQGRLVAEGPVAELLRRERGLHLRIDSGPGTHDGPAKALDLLRRVEWVAHVEQHGETLLVDAPSARAAELNRLLAQHDVAVAEIRAREASLEEFFLEVVEDRPAPPAARAGLAAAGEQQQGEHR
jgi:ABC-2 type transport system ATP-binding protein